MRRVATPDQNHESIFLSKLFNLLSSAVANATDLLFPPVPGLERPGYCQGVATRPIKYAALGETPALPGAARFSGIYIRINYICARLSHCVTRCVSTRSAASPGGKEETMEIALP
jgi:hypothetical protein